MAEEDEENTEGGEEQGKKSKLPLIIIIVVVLLVVGGGAGFFLLSGGDKNVSADLEEEIVYETYEMTPFVVNLASRGNFLKVTLLIEYDPYLVLPSGPEPVEEGEAAAGGVDSDAPGELGKRMPMIRDAVIRVLSAKTADEVLTLEGKEILKEELIEAINESSNLDEPPVINVYFLEFIVQ